MAELRSWQGGLTHLRYACYSPHHRRAAGREAAGQALKEVVTQRAVGVEAELAAAVGQAGVEHRPELEARRSWCGSARPRLRAGREPLPARPYEAVPEADMQGVKGKLYDDLSS
jgi:hypothetical protein